MPRSSTTFIYYLCSCLPLWWAVLGQDPSQEYAQRSEVTPQSTPQYQSSNKVFFPDKWHSSIFARDKGVVKELTQPSDNVPRNAYPREPLKDEYQGINPPPPPLPQDHRGDNYNFVPGVDGYRGDPQPPLSPPLPLQGHRAGNYDYGTEALSRPPVAGVESYQRDPQPAPHATAHRTRFADVGAPPRGGHADCDHKAKTPAPPRASPPPYRDSPKKYLPAETVHRQEYFRRLPNCLQHSSAPSGAFHQQDYFSTEQIGGGHLAGPVKDFYGGGAPSLVTGAFPSTSFDGGNYFGSSGLGNGIFQDPLVPNSYPPQYTSLSLNPAEPLTTEYHGIGSVDHLGLYRSSQLTGSPSSEVHRFVAPATQEPVVEVLKTEVMALPASQIVFDIPPSNASRAASLAESLGRVSHDDDDPLVASASSSSNTWAVLMTRESNRTTTDTTTTTEREPTTTSTQAPTIFVTPPARASRRSDSMARRTMLLMKRHGQPRGRVVVVLPDEEPLPATPRDCPCKKSSERRQRGAKTTRLDDNIAVEGSISETTADFADFRDER